MSEPISVPTESRQSNELQECLEKLQKQWPYCEKSTIELAIRLASLPVGESRLNEAPTDNLRVNPYDLEPE